ncbi:hypothetical protein FS749_006111 [Ceratobasidium sp. UAMH 11750]|nr:hypothetical protein FS749_006111 [Ceratobasidium sp. UAMH 11750]
MRSRRSRSELNGFGNQTISSAEEKRGSKTVALPPMQMSVLPASTVQRVANLKATGTPTVTRSTIASANRATSSPASTMSKASDNSLRTSRGHLPTIAGSPSVGLVQQPREAREGVSAMSNATITKDTPTKIPRMSGRTLAAILSGVVLNPFSYFQVRVVRV